MTAYLYNSVELGSVEISSPSELRKVPAGCRSMSPVELHSDLAHTSLHTHGGRLPTFVWYRHALSEMKTTLQKDVGL